MPTIVRAPQWGMGITEGKILAWLKNVGDSVQEGEPLVELETAKATREVESPVSGLLARILVQAGEIVPVREPLAIITQPGEEPGEV